MKFYNDGSVTFSGRIFSRSDLEEIKDITETFRSLSRNEIAGTVCECLGWYRANGKYKQRECYEFLNLLEQHGIIRLPAVRRTRPRGVQTRIVKTSSGKQQSPIVGRVNEFLPITLSVVGNKSGLELWKELIDRYHYLGFKVPFGAHLRYFCHITVNGQKTVAGCMQFSSPAWRLSCRDKWIGWNDDVRAQNLQYVINNSRFLILPWINIKNLASKLLSLALDCVGNEWKKRYGISPVLAETMVDTSRYEGTCYKAANWIKLGLTSGRGRMDRENKRKGHSPKTVYVYPLCHDFKEILLWC